MPYLLNNYCYPDLSSAASAESSIDSYASANGLITPLPFTPLSTDSVTLNYRIKPLDGTASSTFTTIRQYTSCDNVGPLTNSSGLTISDSIELSWLIIAVWAVSFGFKVLINHIRAT
jgi:hypothetical protein